MQCLSCPALTESGSAYTTLWVNILHSAILVPQMKLVNERLYVESSFLYMCTCEIPMKDCERFTFE